MTPPVELAAAPPGRAARRLLSSCVPFVHPFQLDVDGDAHIQVRHLKTVSMPRRRRLKLLLNLTIPTLDVVTAI